MASKVPNMSPIEHIWDSTVMASQVPDISPIEHIWDSNIMANQVPDMSTIEHIWDSTVMASQVPDISTIEHIWDSNIMVNEVPDMSQIEHIWDSSVMASQVLEWRWSPGAQQTPTLQQFATVWPGTTWGTVMDISETIHGVIASMLRRFRACIYASGEWTRYWPPLLFFKTLKFGFLGCLVYIIFDVE